MKTKRLDIFFSLLIMIIIWIYFTPLFFPVPQFISNPDFGRSDVFHMSISTKYILWQKLAENDLPLWSNKIGSGFPLLGEGQIGMFFLPNLIIYKLFNFPIAYNLTLVISIITISIGMYLWLRLMGFRSFSAFFASLILAFSGIVMTHLTHITLLQGLSLLPWVLVATQLLINRKTVIRVVIFALVVSQQVFAGFPQAVFISLLFTTAYYVWFTGINQQKIIDYYWLVSALILAGLFSAIQWLPAGEFLQNSTDPHGFSLSIASYFSYPFKHLITFLFPFALGNPKFGSYPSFINFNGSIFWENTGFIGIVPLLLIIGCLVNYWRKKRRLSQAGLIHFCLVMLLMSFLLMHGSHSPIYLLYDIWPFNLFRVPSRFLWIFSINLIILSACGLEGLLKCIKSKKVQVVFFGIIVIISFGQLWSAWSQYNVYSEARIWLNPPQIIKFINRESKVLTYGAEIAHNQIFLKQGWVDLQPYQFLKNSLYSNSNVLWDVYQYEASVGRFLGKSQFMNEWLKSQMAIINNQIKISQPGLKLLDLLGINTLITFVPLDQETDWQLVANLSDQGINLYLYRNQQSLPRTYLATQTVVKKTLSNAQTGILDKNFILGKSVLLAQDIDLENLATAGKADLLVDKDTQIAIQVIGNNGDAVLVLSDTFYPGWIATVDGEPTQIYPANITQRAVVVPKGNHLIEFKYQPRTLLIGAIISGLSHLICIVILIRFIIRNKLKNMRKHRTMITDVVD